MPSKCEHPGCKKFPVFGKEGTSLRQFCVEHKNPEMVNVKDKRCEHPGCKKLPHYGNEGTSLVQFCVEHKSPAMIDLKSKRCEHLGCKKLPCFGKEGTSLAQFCAEHKSSEMIDLKHKRCEYPNCKKIPHYGKDDTSLVQFCAEHKSPEMVNIKTKRCEHPGCKKIPCFGKEGTSLAYFCVEHKSPEMIDLKNRRCKHPGCKKQPIFGLEGTSLAQFCQEHKSSEMVDLKHRRCEYPDCKKRPIFGKKGASLAQYCLEHKSPEMVNVKDKRCDYPECTTQCSKGYGFIGYAPTRCSKHKLIGQISNPIKYCEECKEKALGVFNNEYFCELHLPKGGILFVDKCECCYNKVEKGVRMCEACSSIMREDGTVIKQKLRKEHKVKSFLTGKGFDFINDRVVEGGCFKFRPDFLIQTRWGFVVIEVDEHQHRNNECDCELTRMCNIYIDLGVVEGSVVFIRYNPDSYRSADGTLMKNEGARLNRLAQTVKYWIGSDELVGRPQLVVEYLFYDGFIESQRFIDSVDPYTKKLLVNSGYWKDIERPLIEKIRDVIGGGGIYKDGKGVDFVGGLSQNQLAYVVVCYDPIYRNYVECMKKCYEMLGDGYGRRGFVLIRIGELFQFNNEEHLRRLVEHFQEWSRNSGEFGSLNVVHLFFGSETQNWIDTFKIQDQSRVVSKYHGEAMESLS